MTKLTKISLAVLGALVLAVVITFLYEYSRTSSDYFVFYGNIATKDVFHYPEQTTFYTFGDDTESAQGVRHSGSLPMTFDNEMWCHPLDDDSRSGHKMVGARSSGVLKDFVFINTLPDVVTGTHGSGLYWLAYGLTDRETIRSHPGSVLKWAMDDVRPTVSSECYINAKMTTQTPIFGLDKSMFVPDVGRFTYIVDGDDAK